MPNTTVPPIKGDTPADRLEIWKRKLLDLTLRNQLLNCRILTNSKSSTKRQFEINCQDIESLWQLLTTGHTFTLYADPDDIATRTGNNAATSKRFPVRLTEEQLQAAQKELYSKTQFFLDETGANYLYIALGFLKWQPHNSDGYVYAPLVLYPVKLEKTSQGFKLVAHEEEPRFNITLAQMLLQDFNISLAQAEQLFSADTVDLRQLLQQVRKAVQPRPQFEVLPRVVLGLFAFNKYLMWKDLIDRADQLANHPIVGVLLDKNKSFAPISHPITPHQLDKQYAPKDFLTPLPMDSSQLTVLAEADRGHSFVIQGPPGTGKSQTISNLIAHLMGKGKTVLFVSEKKAALDVVYKRLQEAGLAHFCLQLHSDQGAKAKADMLNQLNQTRNIAANPQTLPDLTNDSDRLYTMRDRLNQFVNTLHAQSPNGLTPYRAMGVCIKNSQFTNTIKLNWNNENEHTQADYTDLKDLVHTLDVQAKACHNVMNLSPFQQITRTVWSAAWQQKLLEYCSRLETSVQNAKTAADNLRKLLQLSSVKETPQKLQDLVKLSYLLLDPLATPAVYVLDGLGKPVYSSLGKAIRNLKSYQATCEKLTVYPKSELKNIDSETLLSQWEQAQPKNFFVRFITKCLLQHKLKKAGANGPVFIPDHLRHICDIHQQSHNLQQLDEALCQLKLWNLWQKEDSSIEQLQQVHTLAQKLHKIVTRLLDSQKPEITQFEHTLLWLFVKKPTTFLSPFYEEQIKLLETSLQQIEENYHQLMDLRTDMPPAKKKEAISDAHSLQDYQDLAHTLLEHADYLRKWCQWQALKKQAAEKNLHPLLQVIEQNSVPLEQIEILFETAYCQWWLEGVMAKNPILRNFSGEQQTDKIRNFIKMDTDFQHLTTRYIQAALAQKIAAPQTEEQREQWNFLSRELQRKRKIKPIRILLQNALEAIQTLTPCFMMSPLSIAQYLQGCPNHSFDVVVFDEASQITVWDAVGALSRGKQIIVAGDPKQMPPSNFFERSIEEDDSLPAEAQDLESILDELIGSSMPVLQLNWHYRSRCESLIAFSNLRYYDNSLITTPAANTNQHSISFHFVRNGCYETGKGINKPEAQAVVNECIRRLTDPQLCKRSIGIVTFNSRQQKLLEDLLDAARTQHPEMEPAFSVDNPEALFIKNLETVQGDERDVILFSTTFGPTKDRKIAMNFGPLNREGGERRLNVAVSRSKHEMMIFSSLQPEQIDLSRTKGNNGVVDLKEFLRYAKEGKNVLSESVHNVLGVAESPFEQEVAQQLQAKGWTVDLQVGVSSYRIDLGIVHPKKPGIYLAGIECDGATYHSSATARDRDRIRQRELEGLGWHIIRVWSTDWWFNKKHELNSLHEQLEALYRANP